LNVAADSLIAVTPLALGPWRVELALAATVVATLIVRRLGSRAVLLVGSAGLALAAGLALSAPSAGDAVAVGGHLLADGATRVARLVLTLTALATVLALPARRSEAMPAIALATLGHLFCTAAIGLGGLLLGLVLAAAGSLLARRAVDDPGVAAHRLASVGFALAAFAGAFWCGLGGDLTFAEIRETIAARPSLPPLAVPLVLVLLLTGVLLALLAPARPRRAASALATSPTPLGFWLVSAPLVPLVFVPQRLLLPLPQVAPLAPANDVLVALGAILVLASFGIALLERGLAARLLAAAPGQLGLAWLGFALVVPDDAIRAGAGGVLLVVPLQVATGLLVATRSRPAAVAVTLALAGLATVPPLLGWRLRYVTIEALLAGDALLTCGLVTLATLLGYVVYLRPVVHLWRDHDPEGSRATGRPTTPGVIAGWLLLGLLFIWAHAASLRWPLVS
jgi:NADH:ubiquinone oxidoreductase subunit 2 (subunit N)